MTSCRCSNCLVHLPCPGTWTFPESRRWRSLGFWNSFKVSFLFYHLERESKKCGGDSRHFPLRGVVSFPQKTPIKPFLVYFQNGKSPTRGVGVRRLNFFLHFWLLPLMTHKFWIRETIYSEGTPIFTMWLDLLFTTWLHCSLCACKFSYAHFYRNYFPI